MIPQFDFNTCSNHPQQTFCNPKRQTFMKETKKTKSTTIQNTSTITPLRKLKNRQRLSIYLSIYYIYIMYLLIFVMPQTQQTNLWKTFLLLFLLFSLSFIMKFMFTLSNCSHKYVCEWSLLSYSCFLKFMLGFFLLLFAPQIYCG